MNSHLGEDLKPFFPLLSRQVRGRDLVYLDNAATTQKPFSVLESSRAYYERENSNIHRGTHALSQQATASFEEARQVVAQYLNTSRPEEIIFTSGCTASINLVATMLGTPGEQGPAAIGEGDEIVLSALEHHSNIVPWQMLAQRVGANLKVIPMEEDHRSLRLSEIKALLSERTKFVALTQVSNALGLLNEVQEVIAAARSVGALTLIDGAQAVPHLKLNLQELDADFYTFSGHKMYAPTGIGVLYGKYELLEQLPPASGGGEMIREVTFARTTYTDPPQKHEAGTPNIEGAIALAAAVKFIETIGIERISEHENALLEAAATSLSGIEGLSLYGPRVGEHHGSLSFNIEGVHHYDVGTLLDQMGIAVRTGHHCCQPLMSLLGVRGTVRASVAAYNTMEDMERLFEAVGKAVTMLR